MPDILYVSCFILFSCILQTLNDFIIEVHTPVNV